MLILLVLNTAWNSSILLFSDLALNVNMAVPRVLVTIINNGREILKKPVSGGTIQELETECRKVCPSIQSNIIERVLVYDNDFDDYIDTLDHIPANRDKLIFRFVSPIPPPSSDLDHQPPSTVFQETTRQSTLQFVSGKLKVSHEAPVVPPVINDLEEIQCKSKIFGKEKQKLNRYQEKINEAACALAREDHTLISNKGLLLEQARKVVHNSGYAYAHGNKTRSKVFGGKGKSKKNTYSKERTRNEQLQVLQEQINSIKTQVDYMEKGKIKAVGSSQFGQAVNFEQQAVELKLKLRRLVCEKAGIERCAAKLLKRKLKRPMGRSTAKQTKLTFAPTDISDEPTVSEISDDSASEDDIGLTATPPPPPPGPYRRVPIHVWAIHHQKQE
ncbi:uncharacterized protein [Antedon mediterranea]|uniref:uncharacterized protein n=1 Tax=Antedon mediterranea TaxID=105859 RepID=UPI003AF471C2